MWTFNKLINQFFLICGLLNTSFAVQINTVLGCSYDSDLVSLTQGFQASFYYYPCKPGSDNVKGFCLDDDTNMSNLGSEFYASGYLTSFITATGGVTNPDFNFSQKDEYYDLQKSMWYYDIYGVPITANNYTLELSGYFYRMLTNFFNLFFSNAGC